jgi:hypothetical protein
MSVFFSHLSFEITEEYLREFFTECETQRMQEFSYFKMANCKKKKIPHPLRPIRRSG